MKTKTNSLSIRLIYWITNITFWMYCVGSVFAVALAIALIFNLIGPTQLHVGIPVGIDVIEKGQLELNNTVISTQFVEMYGKIHLIDTPAFLGRIYASFMLCIVLLFFYMYLIFRKFITNVYNGIFFEINNIFLLKKIAYGLVAVWVFTVFYAYFQYFYITKQLIYKTIDITGKVETYPVVLLVALFIWVLSHVFMKGVKLQEDNNFTI